MTEAAVWSTSVGKKTIDADIELLRNFIKPHSPLASLHNELVRAVVNTDKDYSQEKSQFIEALWHKFKEKPVLFHHSEAPALTEEEVKQREEEVKQREEEAMQKAEEVTDKLINGWKAVKDRCQGRPSYQWPTPSGFPGPTQGIAGTFGPVTIS